MAAPNPNEPSRPRIIIFDSSSSVRYTVGLVMGGSCEVEGYGEVGRFLGRLGEGGADLVIVGLDSSFTDYGSFLYSLRRRSARLPVLFLLTQKVRAGISYPLSDFLRKPFFPGDLREKVEGLLVRGKKGEGGGDLSCLVTPLEEKVAEVDGVMAGNGWVAGAGEGDKFVAVVGIG